MKWLGHDVLNEYYTREQLLSEMDDQLRTRGQGVSGVLFEVPQVHVVGIRTGQDKYWSEERKLLFADERFLKRTGRAELEAANEVPWGEARKTYNIFQNFQGYVVFWLKNINTIRIIAHSSNDLERTLEGEYIMVNEVIQAAQTYLNSYQDSHSKADKKDVAKRFNVEFEAVNDHPDKLLEPHLAI